jgi:hypothetical protein
MKTQTLNFDISAMARPKNRQDCLILAQEILAELEMIESHIDSAIARCEAEDRAEA